MTSQERIEQVLGKHWGPEDRPTARALLKRQLAVAIDAAVTEETARLRAVNAELANLCAVAKEYISLGMLDIARRSLEQALARATEDKP